jgi:predicted nucleic acid-binding Zn ribbon protein
LDCSMEKELEKEKNMGILWLVLFVLVWIVLQAYILPKLGIST